MIRQFLLILFPVLLVILASSPTRGGKRSTEGETPKITLVSDWHLSPPDRDVQIAAIRKEFARLQPLLKTLPKESYEFEAEDEPYWDSIHGWQEKEDWVKIRKEDSSEHSLLGEDYYLKDGKLFFYYRKQEVYYYFPEYNYTKIDELRLYFADEKLIYQLEKHVEDRSKKGVNLDNIPNQEVPLPVDPAAIYENYYHELETHIKTLQTHAERKDE